MKGALVFLAIANCCCLAVRFQPNEEYMTYIAKHGKNHPVSELAMRQAIWCATDAKIAKHNEEHAQGLQSYAMDHNQFSDLTAVEMDTIVTGPITFPENDSVPILTATEGVVPSSYDLRTSPWLPPIEDQRTCGSCVAFAAVCPIEYQYGIATNRGRSFSFSKQQVVSCILPNFNNCRGLNFPLVWNYIKNAGGIELSSDYPYTSGNGVIGNCMADGSKFVATITSYAQVETVAAIQQQIVNFGPVSAALKANENFKHYSYGIYFDDTCNPIAYNHAVTLVGYGILNLVPYWIVRNQWSVNWGMNGYMYIQSGINTCGIESKVYFPTAVPLKSS